MIANMVASSYALLPPAERPLFRRSLWKFSLAAFCAAVNANGGRQRGCALRANKLASPSLHPRPPAPLSLVLLSAASFLWSIHQDDTMPLCQAAMLLAERRKMYVILDLARNRLCGATRLANNQFRGQQEPQILAASFSGPGESLIGMLEWVILGID